MATAAAQPASVKAPLAPVSVQNVAAFLLMGVGMFMAILDIQIVSASLREIQAGLSASADEIVWVQSSYLIAEVIMIPLSGFLTRALSARWLFVISSIGFTLFSALCATATSIEEMIVYRALQGFVGGAMIPVVFTTAFALFGRERVAPMVLVSMIATLAPTLGPILGGWITAYISWHWLFLINIFPGIIISIGVAALLTVDKPDFNLLKRIDVPGLLLMAIMLGSLEYVLEEGASKQWFEDSNIRLWTTICILATLLFGWRLKTVAEPILRLAAFKNHNFLAGSILGITGGIGLFGMSYLYPLYLTQVAQMSSGQVGNTLFVSGMAMLASAPLAGILARTVDVRLLATLGFGMMALSCGLTTQITADWRFDQLVLPQILRGAGLMISMVAVNTSAFGTLPAQLIPDASALLTLLRNLGGAIGLAAINTAILTRDNFHYSRMMEHLNPARPEVQARIDELTAAMGAYGGDAVALAHKMISGMMLQQVKVMGFADCFVLMTLAFGIAACVPMLLRKPDHLVDLREAH